ncbi:MAG: glycosyltransferase [Chitinophagales bacterium]
MNDVFSFLIISYNRPKDTIDAVANVLSLSNFDGFSKEIIVVNNASTDSYQIFEDYIAQLSPEQKSLVQYIYSDKNLGVAGGRNLLIQKAKGKYLLFMDDDAEINYPSVIEYVIKVYDEYKKYNLGIVGFKGINPFTNKVERPIKDLTLLKTNNEIFYNSFFGYGHVIKADILQQTGLYQDDFFYGMEEYDIAYTLLKQVIPFYIQMLLK